MQIYIKVHTTHCLKAIKQKAVVSMYVTILLI